MKLVESPPRVTLHVSCMDENMHTGMVLLVDIVIQRASLPLNCHFYKRGPAIFEQEIEILECKPSNIGVKVHSGM